MKHHIAIQFDTVFAQKTRNDLPAFKTCKITYVCQFLAFNNFTE